MSKRDVNKYFLEQQKLYMELDSNRKDFDELLQSGKIEDWQFKQAQNMLAKAKSKYNEIGYFMYLLNMPNNKKSKDRYMKENKDLYKAMEGLGVGREALLNETKDALADFKKMLKEAKEKANEDK